MEDKMSRVKVVKTFFESDGGRKVEMSELLHFKKEDPEGYAEVATLAAAALGVEIVG